MKFSRGQHFLFNHLIKDRKSPCFEIPNSRQIEIITEPVEYYLALHKLIERSERRISMSALYLGTGKLEQYLLAKVDRQIEAKQRMKVNMLFDYMRGMRINKDGASTYGMLKDLKVKHFEKNVRCGLYHNPDTGFMKGKGSNGPLREIFGVHHVKAHVFDSNVMITGANLSEDYFTDRQDRCFVIQDCPPLADYFDDLISVLTDVSFNINDNGDLEMLPHYAVPYKQTKKFKN